MFYSTGVDATTQFDISVPEQCETGCSAYFCESQSRDAPSPTGGNVFLIGEAVLF
jgi:hypothetical protein